MPKPWIALIVAAVSSACVTITPPVSPESTRIEVSLTKTWAQAYESTAAAFVNEGLTVEEGSVDAGVIVSVPTELAPGVYTTYRANIVADSTTQQVVLTGSVRNEQGAAAGQSMTGTRDDPGDLPLHNEMTGPFGEAWQRLVRIAEELHQ